MQNRSANLDLRTAHDTRPFRERRFLQALCVAYALFWIITAINPVDRSDWLVENLLVFAFLPLLAFSFRRLPLSDLSYALLFLFLVLHAIGAHYAYQPPIGDWAKEALGLRRNHFDRLGHFCFGLLLTTPLREVLTRRAALRGRWLTWLAISVIAALSGVFEIIEMLAVHVLDPKLGAAYLGIQGDEWDAQKDMALALGGAALASIVSAVSRRH